MRAFRATDRPHVWRESAAIVALTAWLLVAGYAFFAYGVLYVLRTWFPGPVGPQGGPWPA